MSARPETLTHRRRVTWNELHEEPSAFLTNTESEKEEEAEAEKRKKKQEEADSNRKKFEEWQKRHMQNGSWLRSQLRMKREMYAEGEFEWLQSQLRMKREMYAEGEFELRCDDAESQFEECEEEQKQEPKKMESVGCEANNTETEEREVDGSRSTVLFFSRMSRVIAAFVCCLLFVSGVWTDLPMGTSLKLLAIAASLIWADNSQNWAHTRLLLFLGISSSMPCGYWAVFVTTAVASECAHILLAVYDSNKETNM